MKELNLNDTRIARPFLRWAGGKTWLIKHLINLKHISFRNYHEAFLGGGATYFYLAPKGHSYLSDLNGNLIETYQSVKENVEDIIKEMAFFKNEEDFYYQIREAKFENPIQRAAQFIYLNQTSFNGIYRVNLKGKYNVPYGFRQKDFLDIDTLRSASKALEHCTLFQSDFNEILDNIDVNDLVFLDPPYTVSHNNNGFVKYNEKIFSLNDQIRLSEMIEKVKERGAYYILTNAAHTTIDEIFEKGDTKLILNRSNGIGGLKAKRGQISEFVFTNIAL
ncbi:DNA adenine methylase [Mucilaginibacter angelicae]|uniref:site-specific DNA-methyltransferase (adenine-specific) n=1 Tax=Mucilaginibacter angelicae TaxID=869718 RepID=A0ABV6LAQ8_9SPHI